MIVFDTESAMNAFEGSLGKKIKSIKLIPKEPVDRKNPKKRIQWKDELLFRFEDGSKMRLFDEAQHCCENRFMSTDDELSYYIGAKLLDAEIRGVEADKWEIKTKYGSGYGTNEIQFLAVKTSVGEFVLATHNEHNGYYGGFNVSAK